MPKTIVLGAGRELAKVLAAQINACDMGRADFLAELLPIIKSNDIQSFFFEMPTYQDIVEHEMKKVQAETNINLTVDYEDESIENNSVAFHLMKGTIMAESNWWFSSMQYEKDLLAAEANPRIVAHLTLTNSGGGDAYYNDKVAETVKNLQKPLISLTRRVMASAALFQNAYATKRYATTMFDTIGSLGTMISYLDLIPYFEAMGAVMREAYADNSSEKNARFRKFEKGDEKPMKDEVLNPLRDNFAQIMRDAIPGLRNLDEKDKMMQGTTVFTQEAIDYGIIDGIRTIEEAIQEAYDMGMETKKDMQQRFSFQNKAINTLNS